MTNRRILTEAIEKAIASGWVKPKYLPKVSPDNLAYDAMDFGLPYTNTIIFSHDFAKALWGECTDTMTVQNNTLNVKQVIDMDGWRYHLQMMVISSDPIKYLGANL